MSTGDLNAWGSPAMDKFQIQRIGPLILQKLRKPDSPMQVHKWVPVKFNAGGSPATD